LVKNLQRESAAKHANNQVCSIVEPSINPPKECQDMFGVVPAAAAGATRQVELDFALAPA